MLRTSEEEAEVELPYCYQPVWAESCDLREMLGVVRGWRDVYSEQQHKGQGSEEETETEGEREGSGVMGVC